MSLLELLDTSLAAESESVAIDFKLQFDPSDKGSWLEILKDVVAMANTGGGAILIGVDDNGATPGEDIQAVLDVDPATLTSKLNSVTNQQFQNFEIRECQRNGVTICALLIGSADWPLVFVKDGVYGVLEGSVKREKKAFAAGTVYFRHGAKSEPANSDDLRAFIDRRLDAIKKSWLEGIAKVVAAPPGSRFEVFAPGVEGLPPAGGALRLVNDPEAPVYTVSPDKTHPYRQKEVLKLVNARLAGKRVVTSATIQHIRRAHAVDGDLRFCLKQKYMSNKYSEAFVDWLATQYEADNAFFDKAKVVYDGGEVKVAVDTPGR